MDSNLGKSSRESRSPETGKPVPTPPGFCCKSPTRAHHWIISGNIGRCKYCLKEKEFAPPKRDPLGRYYPPERSKGRPPKYEGK